jgi:hypothetical protein
MDVFGPLESRLLKLGAPLSGSEPGEPRCLSLVGRRLFVVAVLVVAGSTLVGASR